MVSISIPHKLITCYLEFSKRLNEAGLPKVSLFLASDARYRVYPQGLLLVWWLALS